MPFLEDLLHVHPRGGIYLKEPKLKAREPWGWSRSRPREKEEDGVKEADLRRSGIMEAALWRELVQSRGGPTPWQG